KVRCPVASTTARVPTTTKRERSEAIIIVLRGIRSASAPPIRSVVSSPIAWARKTMPNRDEPTSVNARQPSAVKNAASPISETNCPDHSRRKSRWRNASKTRTRWRGADSISTRQSYRGRMDDLQAAVERWSLTLGKPYEQGAAGYTTRATLSEGTPVVLKLVHPHRESEHEADALRGWDGDGAVRLLAEDGDALLLERCEPGTPLSSVGQEAALDVVIGLLPRLWQPAGGAFPKLAGQAAGGVPNLPRTRLGDAAREAIDSLAGTQG